MKIRLSQEKRKNVELDLVDTFEQVFSSLFSVHSLCLR